MRPKHRNEIFNIIKGAEFSPGDFSISERLSDENDVDLKLTAFRYKDSPFIFEIRISNESYDQLDFRYVQYGPEFPFTEFYPSDSFTDFDTVANEFDAWLAEHVLEYEEDQFELDLWEDYYNGQKTIEINHIDFNDKTIFTTSEKKQITLAINEVKLLIERKFNPIESELILINERLDYLVESSKRLNKFDWKSLLFSTIVGIATTLTLDTEKGKLLFELFRQVFSSIKIIPK